MRTIHKYEIPLGGGEVNLPIIGEVNLPIDAKILSVGAQGESLFLWAEGDPEQSESPRWIEVFKTGDEIHYDLGVSHEFIGTAFMGHLVWHVYEYTGV